jgi:hypothetical protein
VDALIALLAEHSGRTVSDVTKEISEHLGTRLAFLLLGDVMDAPNYSVLEHRIANRFGANGGEVVELAHELAQTMACTEAATISRKSSLRDLPYPIRRRLLQSQNGRCAICGWLFSGDTPTWRCESECEATLDHRVPFRLGGERLENLWILCGLCNAIKASWSHIGEHGRIWINNHIYYEGERSVAFWVMCRQKACSQCSALAGEARFLVRRRRDTGAWVADNCEIICENHEGIGSAFNY